MSRTGVRPSWDEYFENLAIAVAQRADCTRRKCGAVIVKNNRIVATGYNGAPAGEPGCLTDGACPRGRVSYAEVPAGSSYDTGPGACVGLHAEQNCLLYCSRADAEGATMYVTHEPCEGCRKMIRGSGILRVVWPEGSEDVRSIQPG